MTKTIQVRSSNVLYRFEADPHRRQATIGRVQGRLLLINNVNRAWGLPDVLFVGGDDVFLAAMGQVAMMPCLVLPAKLCPEGIEASLYATFIALMNASGILSEYLGASLTAMFDVTHDDFDNLGRLVILCASTSLIPLCFLCLLPRGNVADLADEADEAESEQAVTFEL